MRDPGSWLLPAGLVCVLVAIVIGLFAGGLALVSGLGLSEKDLARIERRCDERADQKGLTGDRRSANIEQCIAIEKAMHTDLPPN